MHMRIIYFCLPHILIEPIRNIFTKNIESIW